MSYYPAYYPPYPRSRQLTIGPIHLCGLPVGGYPKGYRTVLSQHQTLQNALVWGIVSGLAYDGVDRLGRIWIEAEGYPATL